MQEQWMVYSDVDHNNNKFWYIIQEGPNVTTKWGRVGDEPQSKTWNLGSEPAAEKEYLKKCKDKVRKGYEKVEVAGKGDEARSLSNMELANVAMQEIQTDNDTTKDLIKYLTEVNIHQILENTNMTYNNVEGVFTTPLGVVVGQNTIDKARNVLSTIKGYVEKNDLGSVAIKDLTNQYLRLIPQNLGRAAKKLSVERIWASPNAQNSLLKIQQQADILDSLEASLGTVLTASLQGDIINGVVRPKVFDCQLHLVEDKQVLEDIKELYQSTRQNIHESHVFKIDRVYTVDISCMKQAWENDGINLSNIRRLWHGTKPSNVLSILKKGLVVPPSNASYVAGRSFGNGVYFSDQSTKSLNYSCGHWDGKRVERCFMFLADVALGKTFIPSSYDRSLPKVGYDSTSALAGKSGVINNEFIVYRLSQANLVYLVEFKK